MFPFCSALQWPTLAVCGQVELQGKALPTASPIKASSPDKRTSRSSGGERTKHEDSKQNPQPKTKRVGSLKPSKIPMKENPEPKFRDIGTQALRRKSDGYSLIASGTHPLCCAWAWTHPFWGTGPAPFCCILCDAT